MESFLHYIASAPEWEELFDLVTASIDDAAKLVDKIPHGLYSELGWQVSFQQLETLLQKYYPRDPAYEEALGGNSPQKRDPPNLDERELIPLHSFEEAGQPTRGPTTERDGQLGVAQTDEDCEQGEATHCMEVEDEGERFAPNLFDVRPRPLQHSRMVALSKRLTVCLRHDEGEFEKVLSLRIMQERGAKLEEVLAVVYHSDKKRFRLGVIQGPLHWSMSRAQHGGGGGPCLHQVYTRVDPSEVPSIIHATCYDFYASILKTGIKPGGGNPRTRGRIHCLRDHVSQHRFFPPGVEIILHLEHAAHTVRWYLTDNGYFVTPDTIPAAAITAVTIIASGQRVSFKDHPPPAASIAMAMACAPSGSRAYMASL